MIEFGVSGLFERFERHFGEKATIFIEALIAVTIVSVCLGVIWQFLVPAVSWVAVLFSLGSEATSRIPVALDLAIIVGSLLSATASALYLVFERRRVEKDLIDKSIAIECLLRRISTLEHIAASNSNTIKPNVN